MPVSTTKIGKRGTVVIPAPIRQKYGFKNGSQLIVEERQDGVMLRPVVTLPIEIYTAERRAEFLLNNTVTIEEYKAAVKEVQKMGLDPATIPHKKPKKR